MFKEIRKRVLLGFPLGVFIGYTLSILESVLSGTGQFYAAAPVMIVNFSSPLKAVIIQYFVYGILGAMFAGTSTIFDIDRLSLLMQTVLHFLITSVGMYICGLICHWFNRDILSTVIWFGIFIVVYIIFWIVFYLSYRKQVKDINESLKKE